jgi:hypothetical protein
VLNRAIFFFRAADGEQIPVPSTIGVLAIDAA